MTVRPSDLCKRVRCSGGAEGWVFAHSLVPEIHVVDDDGKRFTWREDWAEVIGATDSRATRLALEAQDARENRIRDVVRAWVAMHAVDDGEHFVADDQDIRVLLANLDPDWPLGLTDPDGGRE